MHALFEQGHCPKSEERECPTSNLKTWTFLVFGLLQIVKISISGCEAEKSWNYEETLTNDIMVGSAQLFLAFL